MDIRDTHIMHALSTGAARIILRGPWISTWPLCLDALWSALWSALAFKQEINPACFALELNAIVYLCLLEAIATGNPSSLKLSSRRKRVPLAEGAGGAQSGNQYFLAHLARETVTVCGALAVQIDEYDVKLIGVALP
jgi:hypothetical protein